MKFFRRLLAAFLWLVAAGFVKLAAKASPNYDTIMFTKVSECNDTMIQLEKPSKSAVKAGDKVLVLL